MKKLLMSFIALIGITSTAYAHTFSGLVANKTNNQAIPYATVSLLQADSTLQNGTITDENGRFAIDITEETQILRLSFLGYKTMHYDVQAIKERKDVQCPRSTSKID